MPGGDWRSTPAQKRQTDGHSESYCSGILMKIAIRADSSSRVGTGHVMRCLALADELRERDCDVFFLSRILPGDIIAVIRNSRFQVANLHSSEYSESKDAKQTMEALRAANQAPDWLVVDHYEIGCDWERALRSHVGKILVIDDLSNRIHDCDLLLDQNYYGSNQKIYQRLVPADARVLLGTQYALLRSEFRQWRALSSIRHKVTRILVSFGGSDPADATTMTLEALRDLQLPTAVDVVIGSSNPNLQQIRNACEQLPSTTLHHQTLRMAELMSKCDLAIGAAGTTAWERCCLGLPSIIITIADNQIAVAEAIEYGRAGWYVGNANPVTRARIGPLVQRLFAHPEEIEERSRCAFGLVDGKGIFRVADVMLRADHG